MSPKFAADAAGDGRRLGHTPHRARRPTATPNTSPQKGPPGPPHFLLGRTAEGLWAIRDEAARKAGLFCSRAAALRFAQTESRNANVAVTYLPEGLELGLEAA
jgi:hypothetical protein